MIYVTIISNRPWFAERAIKLLDKQTSKEFELIYIDNDTKNITITCSANDDEKIVDRNGMTLGELRNLSIDYFLSISKEDDYLLWLDDDDNLSDNFIEECSKYNDDIITSKEYKRYKNGKFSYSVVEEEKSFELYKEMKIFHFIWGKCFKHSLLKNTDIRCAKTNDCEEIKFYFNALKNADSVSSLDNICYNYCTTISSISNPEQIDLNKTISNMVENIFEINDKEFTKNLLTHEIKYFLSHAKDYKI